MAARLMDHNVSVIAVLAVLLVLANLDFSLAQYDEGFVKPILDNNARYDLGGSAPDRQKTTNAFFAALFDGKDLASCISSSEDYCSYIQHMILIAAIALVFCFITGVSVCCFCLARSCPCCKCKLCCQNCGGKQPTKEYKKNEKIAMYVAVAFVNIWILIFSLGGVLSAGSIIDNIIKIVDAASELADIPQNFLEQTVRPEIKTANAAIAASIARTNAELALAAAIGTSGGNLASSLIVQVSELNTFTDSSALILNTSAASNSYVADKSDTTKVSLTNLDYSSMWQIARSAEVAGNGPLQQRFDDGPFVKFINETLDKQVTDGSNAAEDGVKPLKDNLKTLGDSIEGVSSMDSIFGLAFYGLSWICIIFTILGLILKKQCCFWSSYTCSFLLLGYFFVLFLPFFILGHIMGDFCTVLKPAGPDGNVNAKVVLANQEKAVRGMVTECLLNPEGSILTAVEFDISGQINTLLTDSFSLGDVFPAETTSVLINSSFVDRTTSTNTAISGMTPSSGTSAYLLASSSGIGGDKLSVSNQLHGTLKARASTVISGHLTAYKSDMQVLDNLVTNFDNTEKKRVSEELTQIANNLSKCKAFSDGYTKVRNAWCEGFVVSLQSIYFTQFALGICMVLNLIVSMFAAKRLSKKKDNKVAPKDAKKKKDKEKEKKAKAKTKK